MSQEKVKDSVRTLSNGKKIKVKAHNRTTKGKSNTPVKQHRRGAKSKQDKLREKPTSGKELESRKSELAEKKPESKKEEAKEITAPVEKKEATKRTPEESVAFHKNYIAKREKKVDDLKKDWKAARAAGDVEGKAAAVKAIAETQSRIAQSRTLLEKHEATVAENKKRPVSKTEAKKPEAPTKEAPEATPRKRTLDDLPSVAKAGTRFNFTKKDVNFSGAGKRPVFSSLSPGVREAEEAAAAAGKPAPHNGAGASPKSAKEVPETDFSRRVREWQEKSANRGLPKAAKKKSRPGKVERVFGGGNKSSLKAQLAKISKQFNS